MKGKKRVFFDVQGQRESFCIQCHPERKDDKPWYHHDPVRAIYLRSPKVGFKRVGWYFVKCGHVEIDKELVVEAIPELKGIEFISI